MWTEGGWEEVRTGHGPSSLDVFLTPCKWMSSPRDGI